MKNRKIIIELATEPMAGNIHGGITGDPATDQYIILINSNDTEQRQAATFLHECLHIWHRDHATSAPVDQIERERHAEIKELLRVLQE